MAIISYVKCKYFLAESYTSIYFTEQPIALILFYGQFNKSRNAFDVQSKSYFLLFLTRMEIALGVLSK